MSVIHRGRLSQRSCEPWLQHRCIIVAISLQNPRTAKIVSNTTQAMVTATLLFRYIFVTKPVRIGSARLRINALLPLRPGISRPATGRPSRRTDGSSVTTTGQPYQSNPPTSASHFRFHKERRPNPWSVINRHPLRIQQKRSLVFAPISCEQWRDSQRQSS